MFSLGQYQAALTSAIVVDRSLRGKIVLIGSDRASFLQGLLTNDIAQLKKGNGIYSAYLTPQGRMISDMRIFETGDALLLDVEPSVADELAARLEKLIFAEDTQIQNVTNDLALFGVHGPTAAHVIKHATTIDVSSVANEYDNVAESGFTIARDNGFGVSGFDIYVARGSAELLLRKLIAAGAVVASDETAEVLRIEEGRPKFGVDMNTDTIPLEAGIEDRAISLTKGCYVGQEVIVRVLHRGHGRVARRLVGLLLAGDSTPSAGDAVFAGEKQIGEVTSAVVSPKMGSAIALAYVHRDQAGVGTELAVKSSTASVSAQVQALPFTRR